MNTINRTRPVLRVPLLSGMLLLAIAAVAPAGANAADGQSAGERQVQRLEDRREQHMQFPREVRAPRTENRVSVAPPANVAPPPRPSGPAAGGGAVRTPQYREDNGARYQGPRFTGNDNGPARPPVNQWQTRNERAGDRDYRPPAYRPGPPPAYRPGAPAYRPPVSRPPAYRPPPRYVPSLPRGYARYSWNGRPYYYSSGHWYRPWGSQFAIVAAPAGLFVSYLPSYYTSFWYGNTRYFFADDTYYLYEPARRGYVVTSSPYGDAGSSEDDTTSDGDELYVYPAQGQSEQQQADDRYECHRWAVGETGYDPVQGNYSPEQRADYQRAIGACMTGRGYTVR
ncbi:MAG: hypothetical protein QM696_08930 [Steroidobacteraceae bacterium]